MRATSGLALPWTPPQPPTELVARYWYDRYEPSDARASEYAARHRSAYVWVFFLGTLALIFGATALILHLSKSWIGDELPVLTLICALLELASLLLIMLLVFLGMRRDWHERSIEYRLFAELCRKQQALALLGWTVPITTVRSMASADQSAHDRGAWVAWAFAAEQRAAPLPCGDMASAAKGVSRQAVLDELISEQLQYHRDRGRMAEAAGHTLEKFGEIIFFIVIVCVLLKIIFTDVFDWSFWAVVFGWCATVLPGVSAAFVGILAHSELRLLAEQSHQMATELLRAHRRVERLGTARPLISQDLGAEAVSVATLMLQDLEGWARLFRVKGMELG